MAGKVLDIGGLQMRPGSSAVTVDSTYLLDGKGEPWLETKRFECSVRFIKDYGGNSVEQQITNLKTKLVATQPYLHLLHPVSEGGGIDIHRSVQASEHIGGVRCVKPASFMEYRRGDGSSAYSTVKFTFEAVVPHFTSVYQIISLVEDGPENSEVGAVYKMLTPNVGLAVKQQVRTAQPSVYVQSGTIVHAGTYGYIPPPILPNPMGPARVSRQSPRYIGSGVYRASVGFAQRYQYLFEESSTINALPTRWV